MGDFPRITLPFGSEHCNALLFADENVIDAVADDEFLLLQSLLLYRAITSDASLLSRTFSDLNVLMFNFR